MDVEDGFILEADDGLVWMLMMDGYGLMWVQRMALEAEDGLPRMYASECQGWIDVDAEDG